MNILEKIIATKKEEVAQHKAAVSIKELESNPLFDRKPVSLKNSLLHDHKAGIISEHKRKSPSKGIINDQLTLEQVVTGYTQAGASALSVLTDTPYFGGTKEDILKARSLSPLPILRKDFIIDEYQILEAKSWGADVILLIASNLEINQTKQLASFAKSLGLDVLLEVHDKEETLNYVNEFVDMVGVNNRNLKTFEVSIETSLALADVIPSTFVKIAESGLNSVDEIVTLRNAGFKGFLIGESFMKTNDPGKACKTLIDEIMTTA